MEPSNKSPQVESLLTALNGFDRRKAIWNNKCQPLPIGCGKNIGPFRDSLSEKEYTISGLCQECQDKIFPSITEEDIL